MIMPGDLCQKLHDVMKPFGFVLNWRPPDYPFQYKGPDDMEFWDGEEWVDAYVDVTPFFDGYHVKYYSISGDVEAALLDYFQKKAGRTLSYTATVPLGNARGAGIIY